MFLYTAKFLLKHRVSANETISCLKPHNPYCLGAFGSSSLLIYTSSTPKQPTSGFESIIQHLKPLLYKDYVSKVYRRHLKVPSRPNKGLSPESHSGA